MPKKILFFILVLFAATSTVYAKADPRISNCYNGVIEYADGTKFETDTDNYIFLFINGTLAKNVNTIIENSRSLVPIRVISENLGSKVDWDNNTRTVTISENNIKLKIGNKTASVNGKEITLDAEPKIINNLTYIPLRFVSENLNCNVLFSEIFSENNLIHNNRIIYIDKQTDEQIKYSKDEAANILESKLSKHYEDFEKNLDKNAFGESANSSLKFLRDSIDKLNFSFEISRYYVFDSPYRFIFDKYTGDIFVFKGGMDRAIIDYNENDKNFFIKGFFAD